MRSAESSLIHSVVLMDTGTHISKEQNRNFVRIVMDLVLLLQDARVDIWIILRMQKGVVVILVQTAEL